MRVLVVTTVHHPADARIAARQLPALVGAGHAVTFVAPFTATGAGPPPGVTGVDVPRSVGRRRLAAVRAAGTEVCRRSQDHDVVVLHDPELVAVAAASAAPVVWDVHDDLPAQVVDKDWLPRWAHRPLALTARAGTLAAEVICAELLLAEPAYRTRFRHPHPVVPNLTDVPVEVAAPGAQRVVYVGRINAARGLDALLALAERLDDEVTVEVIGGTSTAVDDRRLRAADASGLVRWHGELPNAEALGIVDGALAGVSLLRDRPNYRHSTPTKVVEYLARGVPVVSTPLPEAVRLVEASGGGEIVDFDDAAGAAAVIERWRADPHRRLATGTRGHRYAAEHLDWARAAPEFVAALERVAATPGRHKWRCSVRHTTWSWGFGPLR